MSHDDFQLGAEASSVETEQIARRRSNVVGICCCVVLAAALTYLLNTGPLVEWIARHKDSKVDEVVFAGLLLLVLISCFSMGRWIGLSNRVAGSHLVGEHGPSPETEELRRTQGRDLVWLAFAIAGAVTFVFFFDTGSVADWIAHHKDTKIDEAIVAAGILLVGLTYFSIRRRGELTRHLIRYEALHQKTVALNREATLLGEMSDLLQSCISPEEAHELITQRASALFPGTSGCVCVTANSRDIVEVMARWGNPAMAGSSFQPKDCWALRRGRIHVQGEHNAVMPCAHLGEARPGYAICLPMMAHGEAQGLLYLDTGVATAARRSTDRVLASESQMRFARAFAEQAAMALASLNMREVLRLQSGRDSLTTLYNGRYMEESLEREVRRAMRKKSPLGVMMLDVDHFKRFNDIFGHEAGEAVLRFLGNTLKSQFRAEDVVCRYGGEGFTVILPQATPEMTSVRATQLREIVKLSVIEFRGRTLEPISLSIGVATFPQSGTTADALLGAAEAALYRAKAEGRDRAVVT